MLTLRLNDTPQRDQGKGTDRSATSRRGDGNPGRGERPNPVRGKNSDRRPSNQSTGSMAQALRDAVFGR
jgi:uncharacterized protein